MKKIITGLLVILGAKDVFAQGTITFNNRASGIIITHVYAPFAANPAFRQIGNGTADGHYTTGGYITGTTDWTGFTLIGGSSIGGQFGAASTFAQLLGADGYDQPEASLQPAPPATTFRTGLAAGQVAPVISTIMPFNTGFATVEMVAWDNSSGLYPTWTQASVAWQAGLIAAGTSGPWNQDNFSPTRPSPNLVSSDGSQYVQSFNLYFTPEPSVLTLAGLGAVLLAWCGRKLRNNGDALPGRSFLPCSDEQTH